MKKTFLLIMACAAFLSACSSKEGIKGTFTGLQNDTLVISTSRLLDYPSIPPKDTVIVRDGKFYFVPEPGGVVEITIMPLEYVKYAEFRVGFFPEIGSRLQFPYRQGDRITVDAKAEGRLPRYKVKGNPQVEVVSELNEGLYDSYIKRLEALDGLQDKAITDKTPYREKLRIAMEPINNRCRDYIKDNPGDPISAYFLTRELFNDDFLKYAPLLNSQAMDSDFGEAVRLRLKYIEDKPLRDEEERITEEKRQNMIGTDAISFTLPDENGRSYTPDFKSGNYTVLEFWATGCTYCMAAIDDIKKFYSVHEDKVTIIGISKDKNTETLKRVIRGKQINWVNLVDTDKVVFDKYYVRWTPDVVIIDKQGKVRAIVYPEEMEETFQELFPQDFPSSGK